MNSSENSDSVTEPIGCLCLKTALGCMGGQGVRMKIMAKVECDREGCRARLLEKPVGKG